MSALADKMRALQARIAEPPATHADFVAQDEVWSALDNIADELPALVIALEQLLEETVDALLRTFGDNPAMPLENEPAINNARAILKRISERLS